MGQAATSAVAGVILADAGGPPDPVDILSLPAVRWRLRGDCCTSGASTAATAAAAASGAVLPKVLPLRS